MTAFIKRHVMLRKIMGTFLIIIGLLGCILPVMPGLIFLFPGLALISPAWEEAMKKHYKEYSSHKSIFRLVYNCLRATLTLLGAFILRFFKKKSTLT